MATLAQIATVTSQINTLITDEHNEEITGTVLNTVMHLIKGLAPSAYTGNFANANLNGSYEITINHGLNTSLPAIRIFDENNRELGAANVEITIMDANNIKLGMGSSIAGAHTYIIAKND
jgi:hypothetical protein